MLMITLFLSITVIMMSVHLNQLESSVLYDNLLDVINENLWLGTFDRDSGCTQDVFSNSTIDESHSEPYLPFLLENISSSKKNDDTELELEKIITSLTLIFKIIKRTYSMLDTLYQKLMKFYLNWKITLTQSKNSHVEKTDQKLTSFLMAELSRMKKLYLINNDLTQWEILSVQHHQNW